MKKKWKNPGAERNSSYAGLYRSWKAILKRVGRPNPTIKPEIKIKISGSNNYKSKKVKCIETGKIYDCCKDAERDLKLSISAVSNAANPKRREKTAGGCHWEYI